MSKDKKQKRTQQEREQDAFMMEVHDEIRHEKTTEFFKKWGKLFIIVSCAVLTAVLLNQLYLHHAKSRQLKEATQFQNASSQSQFLNAKLGDMEFQQLAESGKYGYQAVAYFQLADTELSKNNKAKAIEILMEASKNIKERDLRHLAILKLSYLSADTWTVEQAKETMKDTLKKSSPFYYSATSLFGFICLQNKDYTQAKKIFTQIVNDNDAPVDVKIFSQNALSSIE